MSKKRKQLWADIEFYSLVKRKKHEFGGGISDTAVTRMIAKDYLAFEKWLKNGRRKGF